jgi:hypothetical protein
MRGWSKTRKAAPVDGGQQAKVLSVPSPWWSDDVELTKGAAAAGGGGGGASRPSESELAVLRSQCEARYKEQVRLFKAQWARTRKGDSMLHESVMKVRLATAFSFPLGVLTAAAERNAGRQDGVHGNADP